MASEHAPGAAETRTPAIVIAGTHSGSGKTTMTLAILAALTRRGLRVQSFKVGPDFIDPAHHSRVTSRPGRNLDTWLLGPEGLAETYRRATTDADLVVIEGVMGLFDGRGGIDEAGSTADLARLWDLPIALVVDARGLARSIAPMVLGFATFDSNVRVVGVLANKVGSSRHYRDYLALSLRGALPKIARLGYLGRDDRLAIPSRHLGLMTVDDLKPGQAMFDALADAAEATIELDQLIGLADPPRIAEGRGCVRVPLGPAHRRIAVARDEAFCFYYEDNLDALNDAGGEIVQFSPLHDAQLPANIDMVYLGGGYPEVHAYTLSANHAMRRSIRRFHAEGGAIFAECGGLMACCEVLRDSAETEHPMWGIIPARTLMRHRFKALGYVTMRVEQPSRLGDVGTEVRGHEFHYSELEPLAPLTYSTSLLRDDRSPRPDGVQVGGLIAGYAHLYFGSNIEVVKNLLH